MIRNFKTPKDIDNWSLEQILELAGENELGNVPPVKTRYILASKIYQTLGYDMDKDLLLVLLSEPTAQLALATAGGGKTTLSQVKIILEKIYRKTVEGKPLEGRRVLCLVYNDHNVIQMEKKHKEMVYRLQASNIKGLDIDSEIYASTMHKYCKKWMTDSRYLSDTGLLGAKLMTQAQINTMMETTFKLACKKHGVEPDLSKVKDLLQLYNLMVESLRDYDDCENIDLFNKLNLSKDIISLTFTGYDRVKKSRSLYDFSDMPKKFLQLLQTNEEARTRIQNYHDYIVADEVQDMTPIMMEILRLIKGDHVPLLAIGDEDQNIYSFRGSDIYNILDFENKFEGGEVYNLATNRRCAKNIVNLAKQIVSWNELRFDKRIESIRENGRVEIKPYGTHDGMMINLLKELEGMSNKELENTCICYRNRKSSALLSDKLEEARIPFNIKSGYKPFNHEIYGHIMDILDGLYRPYDRSYYKNLYKILPYITRKEFFEIIGWDSFKREWKVDNPNIHFSQIDFGKYNNHKGFQKGLMIIKEISRIMNNKPMKFYMKQLLSLFHMAFWDNKMHLNDNEEEDLVYTERAIEFFASDLTYGGFEIEFARRKKIVDNNIKTGTGVTLSTFHSLKGLEFDNVYLIDLDEEVFPNFASIEQYETYNDKTKLALKEAETRLFYVACTRARNNLTLYYSEENPSVYIDWIHQGKGRVIEDKKVESNEITERMNMINDLLVNVQPSRESNHLSNRMSLVENLEKEKAEKELELELDASDDLIPSSLDSLEPHQEIEVNLEDLELDDVDLELDDVDLELDDIGLDNLKSVEELQQDMKEEHTPAIQEETKTESPSSFGQNDFLSSILDRI